MVKNRDELFSNIFYISAMSITVLLFIFYVLCLFNVFKVSLAISYYVIFGLLILSLIINLCIILFEIKRKIYISSLVKFLIYLANIVFIGVFPAFGLYEKVGFSVLFNIVVGMVFAIIGVSIFFNSLKTKDNIVRVNYCFVILFSLSFTFLMLVLCLIIKFGVIELAFKRFDIKLLFIDLLCSLIFSIVYNVIFYISLKQNKTLINYCIIEKL